MYTLHDETGNLRVFRCCGRIFITGPQKDLPIQIFCLLLFIFFWSAWIALSAVFVAKANVLLTIAPFLALIGVRFKEVSKQKILTFYEGNL